MGAKQVQFMLRLPQPTVDVLKDIATREQRTPSGVAARRLIASLGGAVPPSHKMLLDWATLLFSNGDAMATGYYINVWRQGKEIKGLSGSHVWSDDSAIIAGRHRPVSEPPRLVAPTLVTEWERFAATSGAEASPAPDAYTALWVLPGGLLCSACSLGAPLEDGVVSLRCFTWAPPFWAPPEE